MTLLETSLEEFLDLLASAAPTPGGGSVAALAGALAAALVEMTCNLTVGRERFAAVEDRVRDLLGDAQALDQHLRWAIEADAAAYGRVAAALKLPRDTAEEKARRTEQLQLALAEAARVPFVTAADCEAVLALCERAVEIVNPAVLSDVIVAAQLARAGLESAAANVEANLPHLQDAALVAELRAGLATLRRDLDARVAAVAARSRERV